MRPFRKRQHVCYKARNCSIASRSRTYELYGSDSYVYYRSDIRDDDTQNAMR